MTYVFVYCEEDVDRSLEKKLHFREMIFRPFRVSCVHRSFCNRARIETGLNELGM